MSRPDDATRPAVLIVRDGWGRNPNPEHAAFNAVDRAATPRCDGLLERYPWTLIRTSGEDVGLPEGTMGNSEVGHQNIGAGRIVDQESVRVTKAIRSGSFFENEALVAGVQKARDAGRYVHLLGIASDAGVHGLMTHLYACLELCRRMNHSKVALHLFTDGRDTGPFTGIEFIRQIEAKCEELGVGRIASICGRYYAMDRDNRWERVDKAYACLTGIHARRLELPWAPTAGDAVQRYYENPTTPSQKGDEFIVPTMIGSSLDEALAGRISDGDTVIFYNYRGDRPREIIRAFVFPDDQWAAVKPSPDTGNRGFNRAKKLDLHFVTLTAYDEALTPYVHVAYPKPPKMADIAGEYLSGLGLTQFRCAETEKFPHVTFFFNDYREEPFEGERRQMAQSPKVATYDLQPAMSAPEVKDAVITQIREKNFDFICLNFANADMVGHTGVLEAIKEALETVDKCLEEVVKAAMENGSSLIITADHGNADFAINGDGSPNTAHTTNPVPCWLIDDTFREIRPGRLSDLAPTILHMMGLEIPPAMKGKVLV